ncbi:MAG: helix-turn-helix domain-containing protein [Methanomicrobia archaeon]|nr:helix-turn-helix domain-containing protein [Methanomicrobia archaeon]
MKYSWKFKLECVNKYKSGVHIDHPVGRNRNTFLNQIYDWTKRYEDLGIDGLKHSSFNVEWTAEKRFELVAKVLAGHSIKSTAKLAHVNVGQLYLWLRKYDEKGMEGLECKKGRLPKGFVMGKTKKSKMSVSEQEELKFFVNETSIWKWRMRI